MFLLCFWSYRAAIQWFVYRKTWPDERSLRTCHLEFLFLGGSPSPMDSMYSPEFETWPSKSPSREARSPVLLPFERGVALPHSLPRSTARPASGHAGFWERCLERCFRGRLKSCRPSTLGPPRLREDEHGVIRVGHTRVSLESVVASFDRGASAEEIVESFPSLDLATVYGTLAYVLTERSAVDEYLSRRKEELEELRAEAERRFPAAELRARLLSRRRRSSEP